MVSVSGSVCFDLPIYSINKSGTIKAFPTKVHSGLRDDNATKQAFGASIWFNQVDAPTLFSRSLHALNYNLICNSNYFMP
jgi:hypothetical protein